MSKKKKPQVDRNAVARAKAKEKQINEMPMNKEFLQAKDEKGNLKYPVVDKLVKYKMLDFERVLDIMRQISAFVAQIRHHQNRLKRLQLQYDSKEPIVEKDQYDRLLTREEVKMEIVSTKVNIPREIARIREYAVDKLLPMVDGVRLNGEQYNQYILSVKKCVEDLGYELFPDKLELIFPEI